MAPGESAQLLRLQTEVLEAVARGQPLALVADILCRRAEALAPDVRCSILAVDAQQLLHPVAGPSMPAFFSAAVDGLPAGPNAGSCGTAAFRKEPVLVTDVETDPLWIDFRPLAAEANVRACWSSPIKNEAGEVLATFAFYYATPRGPDEIERRIVDVCVDLLALAIEHDRVREHNHRLAYYDVLTGLPNRGHFNQLLDFRIRAAAPFGLLLVDIDQLKLVNDTVGHAHGDALLRAVAERLAAASGEMVACRLGGDEFAVLALGCDSEAALDAAASELHEAVSGLIVTDGHTTDPHITIGGALFGADGADAATLIQNADFALYQAKDVRRGGYVHFSPTMRTVMLERANMVRRVDAALTEGRILAHYQPIVLLETSEIVGLEALARMEMPDGRIATAGEFHPALQDPRIAYGITGRMLAQVARDVRHWLDLGIPFQHVGINVSTGDFQRGDLEARIVEAFEHAGVPMQHIILEVNESVFMSGYDDLVPRAVEALRKRGLLVALDDFGTGFASLTHLLSFPVDVIKIDKTFVDRLGQDRPSDVLVGAMFDIARQLKMRVVAEGVETAEQVAALKALGGRLGQGYLFSRPCSVTETTRLLQLFAQPTPDVLD